ncbi:hypothetical protein GM3708_2208 [Geminocystis sp. NIES-3708]|uniref:hypothetical protein n=1 Tax=Geminocystis sp. NIES-3708 TaxID=1615909 RepID=UPI0005FCAE72|nr:hypothetical protein [Geminocystis sp. NIES-3708]BAQ61802.1 hypothetical protein GM3708_2208 [Geminocystis sp. NIES-3708]
MTIKKDIIANILRKIKQKLNLVKRFCEDFLWVLCRRLRFKIASLVAILPLDYSVQNSIAYQLGRILSPFRRVHPVLLSSFQTALGVNLSEAKTILNQWEASKGLSTLNIFRYFQIDKEWINRYVEIENISVLEKIAKVGGLVLTYHTFHQNMLPIIFSSFGIRLIAVGANPFKHLHYRHVTRYKHLRNKAIDKKLKLSGGNIIYTDDKYNLIKSAKTAFANGDVVLLACDTHHIDSKFPPLNLLGLPIRINAGGMLRLAKKAKVPVYFAILYPNFTGGYNLHLKAMPPLMNIEQDMQGYFDFLETHLQNVSWAWEGWWWYPSMLDWALYPVHPVINI